VEHDRKSQKPKAKSQTPNAKKKKKKKPRGFNARPWGRQSSSTTPFALPHRQTRVCWNGHLRFKVLLLGRSYLLNRDKIRSSPTGARSSADPGVLGLLIPFANHEVRGGRVQNNVITGRVILPETSRREKRRTGVGRTDRKND
jgi:hypothetical protein